MQLPQLLSRHYGKMKYGKARNFFLLLPTCFCASDKRRADFVMKYISLFLVKKSRLDVKSKKPTILGVYKTKRMSIDLGEKLISQSCE